MSTATTSVAQISIGAKGRGIGYTKGLPPGAPPEAEFTYLAANVILAEKVRSFQVRSFPASKWTDSMSRSNSFSSFYRLFLLVVSSLASSCSIVASSVRGTGRGFLSALQLWEF